MLIGSSRELGFLRLAGGAVLMGAGIGAMHYSGMAAMQPQALQRYQPGLVAASIARQLAPAETIACKVPSPIVGTSNRMSCCGLATLTTVNPPP